MEVLGTPRKRGHGALWDGTQRICYSGEVQAALSLAEGWNPAGGVVVRRSHCPLGAPGMRSKIWCEESLARAALDAREKGKVKPQGSCARLPVN